MARNGVVEWKRSADIKGRFGLKVNEVAAKQPKVDAQLKIHQEAIYLAAKARYSRHRDTGLSRIYKSKGWIDRHVGIDDRAGGKNAHAIEWQTGVLRKTLARYMRIGR